MRFDQPIGLALVAWGTRQDCIEIGQRLPNHNAVGVHISNSRIVRSRCPLRFLTTELNRKAHNHADELALDLGYTPISLQYNTGRRISGARRRALSRLLQLEQVRQVRDSDRLQ